MGLKIQLFAFLYVPFRGCDRQVVGGGGEGGRGPTSYSQAGLGASSADCLSKYLYFYVCGKYLDKITR